MLRSDATVVLYKKTWFWKACDGTKPTSYAGSLLVTMLLNRYLSLALCVSTELFCKQHFKNAVPPQPPNHSSVNPSCCTGMKLTGVRTQTHSAEHHPPQAWGLLHSWHQWDVHPLRAEVGLSLCLYLLPDALPVVATWLTGILDIYNYLQKSVEFSYSMEKYSFSRK